jgi:hypothetical protein
MTFSQLSSSEPDQGEDAFMLKDLTRARTM